MSKQRLVIHLLMLLIFSSLIGQNGNSQANSFVVPSKLDEILVYRQNFLTKTPEWRLNKGSKLFLTPEKTGVLSFSLIEKTSTPFFYAFLDSINLEKSTYLNADLILDVKKSSAETNAKLVLEYSTDNQQWFTLTTISEFNRDWHKLQIPLDFACGHKSVFFRFSVYSEQDSLAESIEISNFRIIASSVDYTAPLIIHAPKLAFASNAGENELSAEIFDLSGLKSAKLFYRVNNGEYNEAVLAQVKKNRYTFIVPPQLLGSLIEYKIEATDNSANRNTTIVSDLKYIAGYQPPKILAELNTANRNLYYDASFESGIKKVAIPVKNVIQNKNKLLSYLLVRSFPTADPAGNQFGIRFLESVKTSKSVIPGKPLSPAYSFTMNNKTSSDTYGYLLIDLRDQKFGLDKNSDSLLYLELSAEKGKSALVYLPSKKNSSLDCFLSESFLGVNWESAEFTDSTGTVVYPLFQSDLIFSSRDMAKENQDLAENLKLESVASPLNSNITIRFNLPKKSKVTLAVYDLLGREVSSLINGQLREGVHSVGLNSASYKSGIYYYVLKVDDKLLKRKMVVTTDNKLGK